MSNPGPLTYESGALQTELRGPATGGQTMIELFYTILISVDLAYCKIFHVKVDILWQGCIMLKCLITMAQEVCTDELSKL